MFQGNEDNVTKVLTAWIALIGGVIIALISATVALISSRSARKNQRETQTLQTALNKANAELAKELKDIDIKIASDVASGKAFFDEKLEEGKQKFESDLEERRRAFQAELDKKAQTFQEGLEVTKQVFQRDLEQIKADFDDGNSEKKARRDYEYEARKRLYRDVEPLLFQVAERGEEVLYRIAGIAGEARRGNLRINGGWLSSFDEYYATSNAYKLIAPLVVIKLLQKKLTAADLNLAPRISKLYRISKFLTWSFTDDFVISNIAKLEYDPNQNDWFRKRINNPRVLWRQGIPTGRLDQATDALIDTRTEQCMSFGDFEREWRDKGSKIHETFEIIFDMFLDFHPHSRPILWRILIIQAHIYYALLQDRELRLTNGEERVEVGSLRSIRKVVELHYDDDENEFDWRRPEERSTIVISEVMEKPFQTAEDYLEGRLKTLFRRRNPLMQGLTLPSPLN